MTYCVGHNIPGYMPESDVYYTDDLDSAVGCMIQDIEFVLDSIEQMEPESEDMDAWAEMLLDYEQVLENLDTIPAKTFTDGLDVYLPLGISQHDLGLHFWIMRNYDERIVGYDDAHEWLGPV